MQKIERIPQMETGHENKWQYYIYDALIAVAGSLIVTGLIYFSHLYPHISDIVIIHLILIMTLAIWRSRYAAIVAAITAFLSFDYFLVPPLYTLTIADPVQWVALFIFLFTAIVTSWLAGAVRQSAEEARKNAHELRILYELMRVCNNTNNLDEQLDIIVLSTLRVFSSLGITECVLLMPDQAGKLRVRADAPIRVDEFQPTSEEMGHAAQVYRSGKHTTIKDVNVPHSQVHYIPLKSDSHVFCVLYLRVLNGVSWLENEEGLNSALRNAYPPAEFFRTYLDQISSLIERSFLREKLAS
ncbi:DUF4118 domain-containing protein [Dictyobacter aurantiacus]|uniref:Sensor protein KdpD transmembrane domain-containing protein n=1 Tax=Dictyobacter aurantiacus TaxID=1936993 RepID=A0A401ZD21_9CHLR|nr:DUF4118 domain-containing protein [Dictyobacter aurantiacus]GCE04745.1 hypothetical protein KDAU_20740 [Dictyobacter aurantiacus]